MSIDTVIKETNIVDVDTHIIEPPDLWTSRVPRKYVDQVPQIRFDDEIGEDMWYMGTTNERLLGAGSCAMAGHTEYPPFGPKRFSDINPQLWDPTARLAKLDEYGTHSQLLYPNIATFAARNLMDAEDREIHNICIQVYNDFLTEFASAAPDRYFPMAAIPFWDIELSLKELERCHEMGHRGFLFSQNPAAFGLNTLFSKYWDPIWAAAQEMGMVVNFHIGSAIGRDAENVGVKKQKEGAAELGPHAGHCIDILSGILGNGHTLSMLTNGGVCHRFPDLNFVLVESGIGWLPYALDLCDWQWQASGAVKENPDHLLPSEYFQRQIYGAFWFENRTARYAVELYPDNFMFETDYPHPISLCPGPASPAPNPIDHLREVFEGCPDDVTEKVLHGNAARIYNLP